MQTSLRANVPLADRTTFGIGGPARSLLEFAPSVESAADAIAQIGGERSFILGGGSNLLIADAGFEGVVLSMHPERPDPPKGEVWDLPASALWDEVVDAAVSAGRAGLERMAGIPGTVAGAVVQNAEAYGQSIGDLVHEVTCVDRSSGAVRVFDREQSHFRYRGSRYLDSGDRLLIVRVALVLDAVARVQVPVSSLAGPLFERGFTLEAAAPVAVAHAIRALRGSKEHLASSAMSAGSYFKNIDSVAESKAAEVDKIFASRVRALESAGETWANGWTSVNRLGHLIAGSLIATAGEGFKAGLFRPGSVHGPLRLGRAGSNTITNTGGATARDVLALAAQMQSAVFDTYGLVLEPEVELVGRG